MQSVAPLQGGVIFSSPVEGLQMSMLFSKRSIKHTNPWQDRNKQDGVEYGLGYVHGTALENLLIRVSPLLSYDER